MRSKQAWGAAVLISLAVSTASAEPPLDGTKSLRDNLAALMSSKAPVTVVLQNGQNYHARVAAVGDQVVILTQPAQKEFFDVVVPLGQIAAVEVRVRDQ